MGSRLSVENLWNHEVKGLLEEGGSRLLTVENNITQLSAEIVSTCLHSSNCGSEAAYIHDQFSVWRQQIAYCRNTTGSQCLNILQIFRVELLI